MAKIRTTYVCQQCGYVSPQFLGRCPECGTWNSLVEQVTQGGGTGSISSSGNKPFSVADIVKTGDIEHKDYSRVKTKIDEFDRVLGGGIVNGSVVLVAGDPGIGKCVSGSTRVFDPLSGALLPITEWINIKRPILALNDKTNRLNTEDVSAFHNQGIHPVVDLKTRLGRTLRCTLNHPLLTPKGWYPINELPIGTRIATPKSLPFFGKRKMAEPEVKLIAYILSDGSAQRAIRITSALPEVEIDLKIVAFQFGMSLRVYDKKNNLAKQFGLVIPLGQRKLARMKLKTALHKIHTMLGISWQAWARTAKVSYGKLNDWRRGKAVPSKDELERLAFAYHLPLNILEPESRNQAEMTSPAARFLNSVGLRKTTAINKSVPDCIFMLTKDQLALFLKVLFSCDGSVYITSQNIPALSYSTISHKLAQDVQHLLLRFGLVAKLRTKNQHVNNKLYKAYELQILGAPVKLFLEEIGIWGRKEAKAKILDLPVNKRVNTHYDTIPTGPEFWEIMRQTAEGKSFKWISEKAGVHIRNRRHDRPLTRATVSAIANMYPSVSLLQALAFGDIYWDEIESITPVGEEIVYDLTVPESANFVANDLIIHNSTLLSQLAINQQNILYVAGEESAHQIKLRIERINSKASLDILNDVDVDNIIQAIQTVKPSLVIVDSIQTLETQDLNSAAGSVSQVRESAHRLQRIAKTLHIPIFLVGHVTKEGTVAGPRTLEHIVDVVLTLEGDPTNNYRVLRAAKNRFGPTDEVGIFEMEESGMKEIKNPSQLFLSEKVDAPGSAVVSIVTGLRPMLLEIQALVTKSYSPIPRRVGTGIDNNRLQLLVAVLSKRCKIPLYEMDVFVNVTGGIRIVEPASDLAVCMAIISSFKDQALPKSAVFIGEVGLLGELRTVRQLDKRITEAKKLGYTEVISPQKTKNLTQAVKQVLG